MHESMTAVIERYATFETEFVTEPYEAAWAREARWFFVPVDPEGGEHRLSITTEVSPDGLTWCPLETGEVEIPTDRTSTWTSREFGGWLRLRATIDRPGPVRGSLYLALKA